MVLKKIHHYLNKDSALLKHASVLFIAMSIGNLMSYLFQLYMGRALGPEGYGVLGALMSLTYIMAIPGGTVQTFVTKYVSKFSVKNKKAIGWIISDTFKKLFSLGLIFLILFTIFSPQIAFILKIPKISPVIETGFILFLTLISSVFISALRGIQNFNGMGLTNVINFSAKLIFGVFLVVLGFGVLGALGGVLIGIIFGILFSAYLLRGFIFNRSRPGSPLKGSFYFWYVLATMLFLGLFYNIDIILVKIFFPSAEAGYYVAASTIAKIVLFISAPIVTTMFPKASEIKEKGQSTLKILKHTLYYVAALSALVVLLFNLAPGLTVSLLYGSQYIPTIHLIGLFSIGMLFLALTITIAQHNMAVENLSYLPILFIGTIIEITGIFLFHSTLFDVVKVFTISMILVFFSLLLIDKKEILPNLSY